MVCRSVGSNYRDKLELCLIMELNDSFNFSAIDAWLIIKQHRDNAKNVSEVTEIILIIIYCTLIFLGILSNVVVSFVVARRPQMHTARNLYIVNLTVSDLTLCMICMPFTLVHIINRHWTLGVALCKLVPFVQGTNIMVSVGTITVIALDRYFTIVRGQDGPTTRRRVIISIIAVWALSMLTTSPVLFFQIPNFYTYRYRVNEADKGIVKDHLEMRDGGSIHGSLNIVRTNDSIMNIHYTGLPWKGWHAVVKEVTMSYAFKAPTVAHHRPLHSYETMKDVEERNHLYYHGKKILIPLSSSEFAKFEQVVDGTVEHWKEAREAFCQNDEAQKNSAKKVKREYCGPRLYTDNRVVENVMFGEMVLYHSCIEMWPHPTLKVLYTVCILMIQAVIPATVVVCIHAKIARYLHAHATVQRDSRRAQRELSRNKRTTVLLSGVAVLFTVSWLPIGVLLLVTDLMYPPSLDTNVSSENLYIAFAICHIVAMTSAISNPVVYGWLNSNIRRELMQLIPCKCTSPPRDEGTTAAPSPTMVLCQNGQKRPTHQQPATTYTAL